ncbi:DUF2628 domain-containing protein [Paraburkholderia sp. UCT70]|uniref:DUF2628 domain-containing protein n=1 Tax=Paraburkholderia sp. UCT70 TaxID=2991068 RepID=UPI003D1FDEE8
MHYTSDSDSFSVHRRSARDYAPSSFEHPSNGHIEVVTGTSVIWAMLFGPLYFAYKGAWSWAAIEFLASVGLSVGGGILGFALAMTFQFVVALCARGIVTRSYQSRGWLDANRRRPEAMPQIQLKPESSPAKKQCPACAESVLAEAKICRYCRHEFTTP